MLAQLTALLGRLGYLRGKEGEDFVDFILRQCTVMSDDSDHKRDGAEGADGESLRAMCDNILQLLSTSVPEVESLLWPRLLDFLVAPEFSNAVTPIIKSASNILNKKAPADGQEHLEPIPYERFVHANGPYALFARLIVLAAVPFPDARGRHILTFMQLFGAYISKHVPTLWRVRIPLLQHYLDTHMGSNGEMLTLPWDQSQWQHWLMAFLDDTLAEIDVQESHYKRGDKERESQSIVFVEVETRREKYFPLRYIGFTTHSLSPGNDSLHYDRNGYRPWPRLWRSRSLSITSLRI